MTWCRYCGETVHKGPDGEWWAGDGPSVDGRHIPWECARRMPPADPKLRIGMAYHIHHVPNDPNDTEEHP